MDEVDNIIIHSLRQIGCKIDEDVTSLSGFSSELLVETISKCLRLIKPSLTLPEVLPPGMAQRFSVTASLAEACASVGFRGDIGYQTFLYSNVTEIRKVFMFLIERLPKETEKLPLIQPIDKLTQLENEICRNISVQLSNAWIPQYCNKFNVRKYDSKIYALNGNSTPFQPQLNLNIPNSLHLDVLPELHNYWLKRSPNIFQQTNSQTICSSVIHMNDVKLNEEQDKNYEKLLNVYISSAKNPNTQLIKDNHSVELKSDTSNKSEAQMELDKSSVCVDDNQHNTTSHKFLSPLEELNLHIEKLKSSIKEVLSVRKDIQLEIQKMNDIRIQHDKMLVSAKEERKIKERTAILLENPEENLVKLESIIATAHERMKKLTEQWEDHRQPLIKSLEESKTKNSSEISQNKNILDQVKVVREKISDISEELKIKTGLQTQLLYELQKTNKATSRNVYTTRILEIIGNIRKQKNDIDRVLRDTRELQKQINTISGQLDRQFTVTDDLLYKTAKRDEHSKKTYKLLAQLHSNCSELIALVQETGAIMREVRDLEDQIEKEKARNILPNLEKITFDLREMEKDSKDLQEKIRKVENQITQA